MKKSFVGIVPVAISLLVCSIVCAAVVPHAAKGTTGLKLEAEESYLKREAVKMVRSFSKDAFARDRATLPKSVDLASGFPSAGNQGNQASCVAWALAYGIKSFHEHRELGWNLSDANHLFSPAYLYNQINGGRDDGSSLDQAVAFMEKNGGVPLSIAPYDDLDYVTQPSKEQLAVGQGFRIANYRRVAEKNVDELKRHLASGEPIIFAMTVYPTMMGDAIRSANGVYSKALGESVAQHAVVLVGYDDSKQAVRFMNSWGPKWGDRGFGWLTYDFLPKVALRAYVVYDTPTPSKVASYINGMKSEPFNQYDQATGDPEGFHMAIAAKNAVQPAKPKPATLPGPPPLAEPIEPFYLIPEERGLWIKDEWLRIGDSMAKAKSIMATKPLAESDVSLMFDDSRGRTVFMADPGTGRIGQIIFLGGMTTKSAGETNRGLRIGSTKTDAQRIYGTPDISTDKSDAYFYEAVAEDYGGLDWVRNITLFADYDDKGVAQTLRLLKTDKGAMTGSYARTMDESEKKQTASGTQIASASGDIEFKVPAGFGSPQKNVWENVGYGYFSRSEDGQKTLTVKIFDFKKQIADKGASSALDEFIKGDFSKLPQGMNTGSPSQRSWGGLSWKEYMISSQFFAPALRAYAINGDKLYSIIITIPDKSWYDSADAKTFFDSIKVK